MSASDLLGSVLVYLGLLCGALGLFVCLRPWRRLGLTSRRRGAALVAAGILLGLAGLAVPAPLEHSASRQRIDDFVPEYQFREFHQTEVAASPAAIHQAIWGVPAGEIRLFRLFTWIRSPRLPCCTTRETILSPSAEQPILKVATSSGFRLLADDLRDVVIGTIVVAPRGLRRDALKGDLRKIPGLALAVMSFHVAPLAASQGDRCLLTTETRIFATDARTLRRFRAYWRLIAPGSAILRVTWLDAIRARAER